MAIDNSRSILRWWKTRRVNHDNSTRTECQPTPQLPPIKSEGLERNDFMSAFYHAGLLEKGISPPYLPPRPSITPSWASIQSICMEEESEPTTLPPYQYTQTYLQPDDLPPKCHHSITRAILYTVFSVYRRVFSFIFLINIAGMAFYIAKRNADLKTLSTWSSTNFLLAILVRQDFCINLLFRSAWLIPWRTPLRLRRLIARVYAYGGIHTGAAAAGTLWWLCYTFLLTKRYIFGQGPGQFSTVVLAWTIQLVLILIILFACPHARSVSHNLFELTHRFGGWTLLALLWVEVSLLSYREHMDTGLPLNTVLFSQPTFWNLTLMTAMTIYPWLALRHWTFTPEPLSPHALRLHFTQRLHRFSCLSISTSPLLEWHPFATFPAPDNAPGGSMLISAAGDWTHKIIANPQRKYWVKGSPRAGVLSLFCIFKRVVIVTTGSGIGPCLSSILDKPRGQICRVIWSTRSPSSTFGGNIAKWLGEIDPEAVVVDTDVTGRPDLVRVAWRVFREVEAEAVFVLSNREVTRRVVYALESRGVPAYGPIWDS